MASINLLLQSKKNPAVIYIRLRDGRTLDIKAKTNYHIDPANWDEAEQRPTKKALKNNEQKYGRLEERTPTIIKLFYGILRKYPDHILNVDWRYNTEDDLDMPF